MKAEDETVQRGEPTPKKFKDWHREDGATAARWRREIWKPAVRAVAGNQWDEVVKRALDEKQRVAMTFNRIAPVIDAVAGQQIANRQEVRFIPREEGDVKVNELLTGAAMWFRDLAEGDDEDSQAFLDCVKAGMGWTDTGIDYEDSDEGEPRIERLPPEEMAWDCKARRRNLDDARRVWRVRTMPVEVAMEMFEGFDRQQLDATWARTDDRAGESPYDADEPRDRWGGDSESGSPKEVTIAQVQWIERRPMYLAVDPMTGARQDFSPDQYKRLRKRFQALGMEFPAVKRMRNVRRKASLGAVVLEVSDAPCPHKFSWQCVTGKYDEDKGYWYGLVRPMIEPQMWANKWLSQMLNLMNASAKGGVIMEEDAAGGAGAIESIEESWAANDEITWVAPGSISGGKIMPKPMAGIPPQLMQLTEFAISSIRDVSGVNLEMLGMREANQPGVLEYQRREAGMTVLQWLFDGFSRYRRSQGAVILYYLQNDLSDGRLVRILGKDGEQYVPLIHEADVEYDIIVDEAPTAPNQKERTWQLISAIMPNVREMLTPDVMLELLTYSPLPTSVVEKLREMAETAAQSPEAQQQKEMAVRAAAAEISKTEADAFNAQMSGQFDQARIQEIAATIGQKIAEAQVQRREAEISAEKTDAELALTGAQTMHTQAQAAHTAVQARNEAMYPPGAVQMAGHAQRQQNKTPD